MIQLHAADIRLALEQMSYEVLPLKGAEEKVRAHVPTTVPLTVTCTGTRGLEPTLDLTQRLVAAGYSAAPHIAARLVRGRHELDDICTRLQRSGVREVFLIAGDAAEPAGPYADSIALGEHLHHCGFDRMGIGSYPEGHPTIPTPTLWSALDRKQHWASYAVTQMCFDPHALRRWGHEVAQRGICISARIGIPGQVDRAKLVRVSAGLGLGRSARFLNGQQGVLRRLLHPKGFRPEHLVTALAPHLGEPPWAGFHVYTFNDLEGTEAWRQAWLARLS